MVLPATSVGQRSSCRQKDGLSHEGSEMRMIHTDVLRVPNPLIRYEWELICCRASVECILDKSGRRAHTLPPLQDNLEMFVKMR
jgi:hypothetical protein